MANSTTAEQRRLEIVLEARNATQAAFRAVGADVARLRTTVESATVGLFQWTYRQSMIFGRLIVGPFEGAVQLIRGMFIRLAAVASVFFAGAELKNILGEASYLEQQRLLIESLTGSVRKAGQTIRWAVGEAAKTPFEVPQVVDTTTQIISVGKSAEKWFPLISSLAMMSGRGMEEGMRMATRAMTRLASGVKGEAMELLRLLKISAADWRATGIEISKNNEVMGTTQERLDALATIIETKFGDVYQRMQNSAKVAFSNIQDLITRVRYSIAGITLEGDVKPGGFLDEVRQGALELIKWFEDNEAAISRWGGQIGNNLAKIVSWVRQNIGVIKDWLNTFKTTIANFLIGYGRMASALPFVEANIESVTDALRAMGQLVSKFSVWWREHGRAIGQVLVALAGLAIVGKVTSWFIGLAGAAMRLGAALMQGTSSLQVFMATWLSFEAAAAGSGLARAMAAMRIFATSMPVAISGTFGKIAASILPMMQRFPAMQVVLSRVLQILSAIARVFVKLAVPAVLLTGLITWLRLLGQIKKSTEEINELEHPTDRPGRSQTTLDTPWGQKPKAAKDTEATMRDVMRESDIIDRARHKAYLEKLRQRMVEAQKLQSEVADQVSRGFGVAFDDFTGEIKRYANGAMKGDKEGGLFPFGLDTKAMDTLTNATTRYGDDAVAFVEQHVTSAKQAYDQLKEEIEARDRATMYSIEQGDADVLKPALAAANEAYEKITQLEDAYKDIGKTHVTWSQQNRDAIQELVGSYDTYIQKAKEAMAVLDKSGNAHAAIQAQLEGVVERRQKALGDLAMADIDYIEELIDDLNREQRAISQSGDEWSDENINALRRLRAAYVEYGDAASNAINTVEQGTKDYEEALDAIAESQANIKILDKELKEAQIDALVEPLKEAAEWAKEVDSTYNDMLAALGRGPSMSEKLLGMADQFGDPALIRGQLDQREAVLRDHIRSVHSILQSSPPGSSAYNTAAEQALGSLQDLSKVRDQRKALEIDLLQSKIETASAQQTALEASPAKAAARNAIVEQIRLNREMLAILKEQLQTYEAQGRAIPAEAIRKQIAQVTGEIFEMQAALRENLETEFDKMAQKIINAPSNLTSILARTGLAMMEAQQKAVLQMFGAPTPAFAMNTGATLPPTNVDVKVFIGQDQLDAIVDASVSNALNEHYPALIKHTLEQ